MIMIKMMMMVMTMMTSHKRFYMYRQTGPVVTTTYPSQEKYLNPLPLLFLIVKPRYMTKDIRDVEGEKNKNSGCHRSKPPKWTRK